MKVKRGKPLDVLSLKQQVVADFPTRVERARESRTARFESPNLEVVKECPICEAPTRDSRLRLNVDGGSYHQCLNCSHLFVIKRPTKVALGQFYSGDTYYASTYTDGLSLETRVNQVAIPKAEWMIEQFENVYGRKPKSVLDVGAGMGHFVYVCKRLGLEAAGIEISMVSRACCPKEWGIELLDEGYETWEAFPNIDIITFWGLLEHVTDPLEFLRRANRILRDRETLVVAEVPRWHCISTKIQRLRPNSIVRHLGPLGHIQFFTDRSLKLAFSESKFTPIAAWYFGMDAYEVMIQCGINASGKCISFLQSLIDRVLKQSDTMVLAAKPWAYISDL